eukprot:2457744-Rhodomonas_salina.3
MLCSLLCALSSHASTPPSRPRVTEPHTHTPQVRMQPATHTTCCCACNRTAGCSSRGSAHGEP